MRARQAAAAPQKLHRPHALPLSVVARPPLPHTAAAAGSTAAFPMPPGSSNAAAARPAALMSAPAQPQTIPAASLQIAAALASQPSQHAPLLLTSSAATPAAATAAHASAAYQPAVAAASHAMPTAGAGLVSFIPQLSQLLQPQLMQQGLPGVTTQQQAQQVQQAQQAQLAQQAQQQALAGRTVSELHPSAPQLSSTPPLAAAAGAPIRPGNSLASLMPGQSATAPTYAPVAVAGDTAAVAGSSRGLRLVHKASLDVLLLKLRLVDLVQGCPALQPKVSSCTLPMSTNVVSKSPYHSRHSLASLLRQDALQTCTQCHAHSTCFLGTPGHSL